VTRRNNRRHPPVVVLLAGLGLLALLTLAAATEAPRPATRPVVLVARIEGVIDLGLAPFVERDALLRARVRTVAFDNKRAISAGALISLAAVTIAMADGGTIGAAMPVEIRPPGAPAQPVVDKGKLLTLTTEEALKHGLADFRADSLPAVLKSLDLASAEVRQATQTWAETLARFLTHPVVSSLLMAIGILGIIVEIRTPGFGVPGALGMLSLALFFWGHWLVRLAGWEELLLVGAGVILLAIDQRHPRPRRPPRRPRAESRRCRGDLGGHHHRRRAGRGVAAAGDCGLPGHAASRPTIAVRPTTRTGDGADREGGFHIGPGDGPRLARQARDCGVDAAAGWHRRHRG